MTLLFAWRYFKAPKSTNAINIIAWIAIAAITIGTAALILVLSVFNGFEDLVKSLYSSFYPDLKIVPATGKELRLSAAELQRIRGFAGVRGLSRVVEEKALLQYGDYQSVVYLKGVDSAYPSVSGLPGYLIRGSFALGTPEAPQLVLGFGVENALGVTADRSLSPLLVYTGRKGEVNLQDPLQSVSTGEAYPSGSFIIQQEFDSKYALTNLGFVRSMLSMSDDAYGAVELSLAPDADPEAVRSELQSALGGGRFRVLTRFEQNVSLYSVMELEKWFIYGILSLILVVAAFNMIGALTMLVLEKRKDITVLHALGADASFIRRVFLTEGLLLAAIGGLSGMLLALGLAWAQVEYKLVPLQGATFLIDYFPVKLKAADFLLVGTTVVVIAVLASVIPARKAANSPRSTVDGPQ